MMSKKSPQLRFEGFTDAWEERKLGDYIIQYSEKTKQNNQYPVFTSSRNGLFFQKDYYKGNQIASEDNIGYNIVPRGYFTYRHMSDDLVFKFNINDLADYGIVSTLYPVFTTNEQLNSKYLQYQLNEGSEFRRFSLLQKQGGSRTYMYLNKLQNMILNIPKLEEQQKIGSFFQQLDETIALHQRKLDLLKEQKKGYLQKMFPKKGEKVPELRFGGFTDAWEERKFGEVIDSLYNGQTPSRANKANWKGKINWLTSGELNRGTVTDTIEKITSVGQKDALLRIVPAGTFVIAITGLEAKGTRGNCAKLAIDTTLNQSCMAIFPNEKMLDTKFLFQWYRKVGEEYGLRYTQGTKQQSYNAELIKILPITLPKLEEQIKIADFLDQIDDTIALHQRKLDLLKEQKKGFLQKMFV